MMTTIAWMAFIGLAGCVSFLVGIFLGVYMGWTALERHLEAEGFAIQKRSDKKPGRGYIKVIPTGQRADFLKMEMEHISTCRGARK